MDAMGTTAGATVADLLALPVLGQVDHGMPPWHLLEGTAAAFEQMQVQGGMPCVTSPLAGLQYYAYRRDDGLDGKVRPRTGDRLHLLRDPGNPFDGNAVKVYWRNEHQLGHLPRRLAAVVALSMDRGVGLRAYVLHEGNGCPWSCKALLVGEPLRNMPVLLRKVRSPETRASASPHP